MIRAGTAEQINWGDGNWIFLDVGFSGKVRSCGLVIGDGVPKCLKFSDAKAEIERAIANCSVSRLVIEAPLSVCFDRHGNPTGRSIEIQDDQRRYWYVGPGCSVMIASFYLINKLSMLTEKVSIDLFEGFVSYKSAKRSDHREDVLALRDVVRDPGKFRGSIYTADQLKKDPADELFSAFRVLGLDCGVPAVIKPPPILS
jgi:hypothetical protein